MAAALQFLQENGLTDYDALAERTAAAVDRAHVLAGELREVEERLASYRAAKAVINDILDGAKLPRMEALKKERRELAERKKKLYAQYRAAQQEMREAVAVKANIDHLLDLPGGRENKAQER